MNVCKIGSLLGRAEWKCAWPKQDHLGGCTEAVQCALSTHSREECEGVCICIYISVLYLYLLCIYICISDCIYICVCSHSRERSAASRCALECQGACCACCPTWGAPPQPPQVNFSPLCHSYDHNGPTSNPRPSEFLWNTFVIVHLANSNLVSSNSKSRCQCVLKCCSTPIVPVNFSHCDIWWHLKPQPKWTSLEYPRQSQSHSLSHSVPNQYYADCQTSKFNSRCALKHQGACCVCSPPQVNFSPHTLCANNFLWVKLNFLWELSLWMIFKCSKLSTQVAQFIHDDKLNDLLENKSLFNLFPITRLNLVQTKGRRRVCWARQGFERWL